MSARDRFALDIALQAEIDGAEIRATSDLDPTIALAKQIQAMLIAARRELHERCADIPADEVHAVWRARLVRMMEQRRELN